MHYKQLLALNIFIVAAFGWWFSFFYRSKEHTLALQKDQEDALVSDPDETFTEITNEDHQDHHHRYGRVYDMMDSDDDMIQFY
jgi:hypothetical protein